MVSEHRCRQHGAVPLNKGKGEVVRMNEGAGPWGCGEVQPTWMRAQGEVQLGCRTRKYKDGGQEMGAMDVIVFLLYTLDSCTTR